MSTNPPAWWEKVYEALTKIYVWFLIAVIGGASILAEVSPELSRKSIGIVFMIILFGTLGWALFGFGATFVVALIVSSMRREQRATDGPSGS